MAAVIVYIKPWFDSARARTLGAVKYSLHSAPEDCEVFARFHDIPLYSAWDDLTKIEIDKKKINKETYDAITKNKGKIGIFISVNAASELERKCSSQDPFIARKLREHRHINPDIGNVSDSDSDRYAAGISNAD